MKTTLLEACMNACFHIAGVQCDNCRPYVAVVTTGGTYLSAQDFLTALRQVEIERDAMATETARLIAEVDRLRGLLREALDLADEAIGYTPEYFQDKWQLPQTAARLRRALGEEVE